MGNLLKSPPPIDTSKQSLESSLESASSSLAALHAVPPTVEGALIPRLDSKLAAATAHVTASVDTAIAAVQQCVPGFVSYARRRARVADKRLEGKADELADTAKAFAAILQQSFAGDDELEFMEDSGRSLIHLLECTEMFLGLSAVVTCATSDAAIQRVGTASHVGLGVDLARSQVSHDPWLAHGDAVCHIAVTDTSGDPFLGLRPSDVHCEVESGAVGWTVVSVSVEVNRVTFGIALTPDCSAVAVLEVEIGGATRCLPLKAVASPAAEATARAVCRRVLAIRGGVTAVDVTELVTACGAALSSLTVAEDMINAVYRICDFHQQPANRGMCAAAGVIPLVVTALSTHGVVRAGVAARGCEVLGRLASSSRANADAVVVSEGGMRVICTVMATHADDEDVQRQGCWAVWVIARYVSPAAMLVVRDSRAVELIVAAMKRSPREGNGTVKYWGSFALAKLTA